MTPPRREVDTCSTSQPSRSEIESALRECAAEVTTPFACRVAVPGDEAEVLRLLDEAVRWLNQRGITEQWGTEPFSALPKRVSAVEGWVRSGGTALVVREGEAIGALTLGEAAAYVPAPVEREVYVVLLVASPKPSVRGAGRHLLGLAERVAHRLHARVLRVDCYAGDGGALRRFYESAGFEPTTTFDVDGWPGQVLRRVQSR